MKILTEANYNELTPNTDPFSIDDMSTDTKDAFLTITSAYRYMLIQYLIDKLNLKAIDDLIKQSELEFLPVSNENMDVYQSFNCEELTYLYLRNNVKIINLSKEERNEFYNIIEKTDFKYNEKMAQYIEKTYRKVIHENIKTSPCLINFGPISQTFMVPNDSLVIGMRYDEFNLNNASEEAWDEKHDKQIDYLSNIFEKIINAAKEKLKIACYVIKYDEFSVIETKNK